MTWYVISGGQTGVDTGAIEGAEDVGVGFGGYAPAGWTTEDGQVPPSYRLVCRSGGDPSGLVAHESPRYEARTITNVNIAGYLLVVVPNLLRPDATPGTAMTIDMALRRRRHLPYMATDGSNVAAVRNWLKCVRPAIRRLDPGDQGLAMGRWAGDRLMVAGPRASLWPEGAKVARAVVNQLFERVGKAHRQMALQL